MPTSLKIALYALIAFLAIPFLLLWGIIGYLLTLDPCVVALSGFTAVLGISLTGILQYHYYAVIFFPILTVVVFALMVTLPRKRHLNVPLVCVYLTATITRRYLLNPEDDVLPTLSNYNYIFNHFVIVTKCIYQLIL